MAKHVRRSVSDRGRKRSQPGHVGNIVAADSSHPKAGRRRSQRVGKGSFAEEGARKKRIRNRFALVIAIILALAIALAVGVYFYFKTVDDNLQLVGSDAAEALVEPAEGEPYYVLCTADLAERRSMPENDEDMAIMLARVDEQAKTLSFLSIPASLELSFPDGSTGRLGDMDDSQDGSLISAVSELVEVPISHIVKTDAHRIEGMVEELGGISMAFETEIDDPDAGIEVIDAGEHELTPSQVLVVLRATNIHGGLEACAANRVEVTRDILADALDDSGLPIANIVSDASSYISTDWSASSLLAAAEAMQPFTEIQVSEACVPVSASTSVTDGRKTLSVDQREWSSVKEAFRNGDDPSVITGVPEDLDLADIEIEIRNGTSVEGLAASLADTLENLGYSIGDVGNTNEGIVYPDTMVIYLDPDDEGKAKKVLSDLQAGRLVNGGDYYTSSADVLVIIGSDWA